MRIFRKLFSTVAVEGFRHNRFWEGLILIQCSFFNAAWLLVIMGASSSTKTGGKGWGLYFDPASDQCCGKEYNISDGELLATMSLLINVNEAIEEIWVYKCPLLEVQLSQVLFHHQFVVLETSAWWWSIEKNAKVIAIQRSKRLECVRDRLKRQARNTPVEMLSHDKGRKCMKDLLEFLYMKDELNKTYDWLEENCKDFAKRIFDEFAAKEFHEIFLI